MSTKKTPIRIFITNEDRAKLSYLAGDAMETPNKVGAQLLTDQINKMFDQRTVNEDGAVAAANAEPTEV